MNLAEKVISLYEGESIDFLMDQLLNDEFSNDKEMLLNFTKETKFDKDKLSKLIKVERPKYLKGTYDGFTLKQHADLINKYLK